MFYFDLHVHPSTKGSLTFDPKYYHAWRNIALFRTYGVLKRLKQVINSQANLKQLEEGTVFSVAAFVAIEKAFARNKVINKILADRRVSPLDRRLLNDVACDRRSYFEMFQLDLGHLYDAQGIKSFNILLKYQDFDPGRVNVILSIEGAHCFQEWDEDSMVTNFRALKADARYRFHHLTLTHLTRQAACVHCFGVKMRVIVNAFPDPEFRPDPKKIGISETGIKIIEIAYNETEGSGKRILIDIKHMSYVSRLQFYEMRKDKWKNFPLIVSHTGVTGYSFKEARIRKIKSDEDCDEVFWYKKESPAGTYFNPWTINLFDDDIERIIESNGLIGISLDQRILGFGKIYGEYMSKLEVANLELKETDPGEVPDDFKVPDVLSQEEKVFYGLLDDEEIKDILAYEEPGEAKCKALDDLGGDLLFDLDEKENAEEEDMLKGSGASHIDYLACNILHVVKVGLRSKYSMTDVIKCICLGSDLDGLIDAMNFPHEVGGNSVNQRKWIKVDKYNRLREELILSISRCIAQDPELKDMAINVSELVKRVMCTNGPDFLKVNFI